MKQIIMVMAVLCSSAVSAQTKEEQRTPNRFNYYVNGSFGFYFPLDVSKSIASRGGATAFQFQANYKRNLFARVFFDQFNVKYEDEVVTNGITTSINEKVNTLSFGLDIGYTSHLTRKFALFAYVGGGNSSMDAPKITFNTAMNNLRVETSTRHFFSIRTGAGAEYEFSKLFILYTDFQYLTIPFETDISKKRLNSVAVQIGFKTPLQ